MDAMSDNDKDPDKGPLEGVSAAAAVATPPLVPVPAAPVAPLSMGALIKESIVRGDAVQAKRTAQEWIALCAADTQKAVFCAIDCTLELAGISGSFMVEDVLGEPGPFLEQLPEWVRDKNLDLTTHPFSTVSGRPGKRSVVYWERFWAHGLGSQSVGDVLSFKLPELLERWLVPMSRHGIRTVRHAATVAALAIAQALGHHLRELTKQLDTIRRQLEVTGGSKKKQTAQLDGDMQVLEERIKIIGVHRNLLLEGTIPHRNRDLDEVIRLHSLGEVDRLMKQEPAMYLQQKWTARVFLMIHDQHPEVRLKALACIGSWFERLKSHRPEVKEHLLQFAERCMLHIVDRSRDTDSRVACKAIQMLRLPVLAERMTDEEVERVVNLVSMGTDAEVRQESALFVNAQVFQDPGICVPEGHKGHGRKRRRGGTKDRDRREDAGMSELSEDGEADEHREERDAPDNVAMLLNSETSISMFIEYLENYMGQTLRLTDRAVSAFWSKAPCLSHWHTMVSLMILGESSKGPGLDPVSTRQRLILLHVMEAAVRRATEDVKKAALAGHREKEASAKMDAACNTIVPELPRLFELCRPEEKQVLIVSHICKLLIDHAESKNLKEVIWNARSLGKILRQFILNRGFTDVVKHCTDSLLVISVFVPEVKAQFIEVAKRVHDDTVKQATAMREGQSQNKEELRALLGKFSVINQRGIDMSFGSHGCLDIFFQLLEVRVSNMRLWQAHCKQEVISDDAGFEFPAAMPDTGHTIYLIECCMIITNWYFRFCHWEHYSPGSTAVEDLDSSRATRVKETRVMLPTVFLQLRSVLCAIMETDGSPHAKLTAFSSYMTIMQVAVGVSEGMHVEGRGGPPPLPAGHTLKDLEDLEKVQMPKMQPEHQKVIFAYLSDLFAQVQKSHAVPFDDEGQKVVPHDIWPPLALKDQYTSPRFMLQELLEGRAEVANKNDFETEDGEQGPERQLLRAIMGARMVLESEIEDVHAGPIGQLVLTQLDRSKPRPLRDVASKLQRRLRDLARISNLYAEQYFEAQKAAVIGLYDQVGAQAALSMSVEFARMWGPRVMPWLEKPLFDTLLSVVDECGVRAEQGGALLEAFSYWVKGEEFVTLDRRTKLKEKAQKVFEENGIDASAESAGGLRKFLQRCDFRPLVVAAVEPAEAAAEEAEEVAADARPWGTPIGRRIRGKQTVHVEALEEPAEVEPAEVVAGASPRRKKARPAVEF